MFKIGKWFLLHKWLETKRSSFWRQSVGINILIGFFVLLMLSYVLLLGIFIDEVLKAAAPGQSPIFTLNGILLYYFMLELLLRFMLQSIPVMTIEPYLHLPIKKSHIVNYFLGRSLLSAFNYLPLFVFIPFTIKVVMPEETVAAGIIWLIGMISIMLFNNFLIVYFKKLSVDKPILTGILGLVLLSVTGLHYAGILPLFNISGKLFSYLIEYKAAGMIPIMALTVIYLINYSRFKKNTYLEEISVKKKYKPDTIGEIPLLRKLGEVGRIISMELKLIKRNKRPKSLFVMAIIMLPYGLLFYTQDHYMHGGQWFLIFVGIFITGLFMMSYGNLLFSWNSSFFDGLLSLNIRIESMFRAKLYIMSFAVVVSYIVSWFYLFFGWEIILINSAAFLYNLGVSPYVIMYFALSNPKYISLSKGQAFNFEGVNAAQYISMLPVLVLPILLYLPFHLLLDDPEIGFVFIGVLGIISMFMSKIWIRLLVDRFYYRKYFIAENFRQS